jgi:hypothetical protein
MIERWWSKRVGAHFLEMDCVAAERRIQSCIRDPSMRGLLHRPLYVADNHRPAPQDVTQEISLIETCSAMPWIQVPARRLAHKLLNPGQQLSVECAHVERSRNFQFAAACRGPVLLECFQFDFLSIFLFDFNLR